MTRRVYYRHRRPYILVSRFSWLAVHFIITALAVTLAVQTWVVR